MPPLGAGLSKNWRCLALSPSSHLLLGSTEVDVGAGERVVFARGGQRFASQGDRSGWGNWKEVGP